MSARKTLTLQSSVSDDLNYGIWARITKTTLLEEDLWDVVKYGIPPKIDSEEFSEWRFIVEKDAKAVQILRSSLPDSVLKETLKTTSSKDLWDLLNEANEETKRWNALPEYQIFASDIDHLTLDKDMWMISINTENHMTPYAKYFTMLDRAYRARVIFRSGDTTMAEGIGDVRIRTKEGIRIIMDVLFVPGIDKNVVSVPQLMSLGFRTCYEGPNLKCTIKDESGCLFAESRFKQKTCFFLRDISNLY